VQCLSRRSECFGGRPVCAKCTSLATGDYSHDYLAAHFTARELRQFLLSSRVAIDDCREKHDLIELVLRLRRSSVVQANEEEHSRFVSQLRVGCRGSVTMTIESSTNTCAYQLSNQTLNLILTLTLTARNSEHSTKYSHMSYISR